MFLQMNSHRNRSTENVISEIRRLNRMVQQNSASESTINKSENTHDPKKQVMIEYEFLERMFDLTGKQVSDYDPNSKEAKIIRKCFAIIDIQVDQIKKIRTSLMRRQNVIFVAMIIVGLFLTITSQLIDKRLLSEGIAFIIVGFVGMLMSWTTMDIGASIKEAIYDVGRQNLTVLESIAKSQNEMIKSLNEIKEILQDK